MMANRELSLPRLRQDVQMALKHWRDNEAASAIGNLHLFHKIQQTEGGNPREVASRLLLRALAALEAENPRGARLLRLRFLDNVKVETTAHQLNLEESTLYTLQREAIEQLTGHLYQLEEQTRRAHRAQMAHRLEAPTYTTLVGVANHLAQLTALLTAAGPPWVVALEGLGGLGKTALAHCLTSTLLDQAAYTDMGWVTARPAMLDLGGALRAVVRPAFTTEALIEQLVAQLCQEDPLYTTLPTARKLPYLETRLKQQPHLIIIDNLETLLDLEVLLPLLSRLTNPSKFLLTSRYRLESESSIFHFTLSPLAETDALQLVRQEARLSNLVHVAEATDDELQPIYATVGGNPLALRLVVGQTYAHSLAWVLADLQSARGAHAAQLYAFIYRRAWEMLDKPVRDLWLCLPLVIGPVATVETLAQISGQESPMVGAALEQLVRLNLVDCHGPLNARYYSIHNLTRTFLQQKVANWL